MHFLYYLLLYFPCSFFITSTAFSHALPTRLLVDGAWRIIKRHGKLNCIPCLNSGLHGSAGFGILPSLPANVTWNLYDPLVGNRRLVSKTEGGRSVLYLTTPTGLILIVK